MIVTRKHLSKKITFSDWEGYLLVEGFENEGKKKFVYGRGTIARGAEPDNPKRPDKIYFVINDSSDKNEFALYKAHKSKVLA